MLKLLLYHVLVKLNLYVDVQQIREIKKIVLL
jgi:hypothetical protein